MFLAFKLSFVVDILAFFDLATFWAIILKKLQFFNQSSGHPGSSVGIDETSFDLYFDRGALLQRWSGLSPNSFCIQGTPNKKRFCECHPRLLCL
jgi:hypothetical protein